MLKELVMEDEYATLWYYPELKIVYHVIKKYTFGEHLKNLLTKGSELLKIKGATKWLSDDRNNNALTIKDADWANNVWLPNTAKLGWKYWALVQPERITGRLNMDRQASITENSGITVKKFNDPDEAMKWLSAQ